jgi:uncharacterized protein
MSEASAPHNAMRHNNLDALRGFAVMGILAMNIVAFAMPQSAYISPKAFGGETLIDRIIWFLSFVFVDGKMRGLFSLLFGASMALIIERAEARGHSAKNVHFSRMGWLAVIGLIHYFFIWDGDILFTYAVIGCIAYRFRKWEPRRLIKWAVALLWLGFILWAVPLVGMQVAQYLDAKTAIPGEFQAAISTELELYRGSYSGIIAYKFSEWFMPISFVSISLLETLPLMMVGMAMKKNGFITGEWARADYLYWAKRLMVPGLILSVIIGMMVVLNDYNEIDALAAFMAWGIAPRFMLVIAYAALLTLLITKHTKSAWMVRVASAGRAAFSNYLGTSIVMTTIFYGYGFGLYGYVSRLQLLFFVIGACTFMLLWSKPWLDRFHYGPMEWVWRSLARRELQKMRH